MTTVAALRRADSVHLSPAGLQLTGLLVDDPAVVAGARAAANRGEDLARWVTIALHAGAVAVSAASNGAELDQLRRALGDAAASVGQTVQTEIAKLERTVSAAVDPDHGRLAQASQAAVTRLAHGVGELITGPDAAVPARIQNAVQGLLNQATGEISRSLAATAAATQAAVEKDRSELHAAVVAAVQRETGQLAATLAELRATTVAQTATQQARQRSSAKGDDWEERCLAAIGAIAANAGDGGASRVGATNGTDGVKVGDLTVELTSLGERPPTLVVEAKCRTQRATAASWRAELAAARSNRNSAVALGITTPDTVPVPGQRLLVLDNRSIVLGYDPDDDPGGQLLTAAYLLLRLIASTQHAGAAGQLDVAEARRQVRDLVDGGLQPINALERQLGAADKAITDARKTAVGLREGLVERITRLQAVLTPAVTDPPVL